MIKLRKENETLADGDYTPLHIGRRVFAFARTLGDELLISVMNMSGRPARMPKRLRVDSELIISNYEGSEANTLAPFEYRLIRLPAENNGK